MFKSETQEALQIFIRNTPACFCNLVIGAGGQNNPEKNEIQNQTENRDIKCSRYKFHYFTQLYENLLALSIKNSHCYPCILTQM